MWPMYTFITWCKIGYIIVWCKGPKWSLPKVMGKALKQILNPRLCWVGFLDLTVPSCFKQNFCNFFAVLIFLSNHVEVQLFSYDSPHLQNVEIQSTILITLPSFGTTSPFLSRTSARETNVKLQEQKGTSDPLMMEILAFQWENLLNLQI